MFDYTSICITVHFITFDNNYDLEWFVTPLVAYTTKLNTHTRTTVLRPSWILSGTMPVSWHQKCKTRKVKPIWIYWSKRQWVAVASA